MNITIHKGNDVIANKEQVQKLIKKNLCPFDYAINFQKIENPNEDELRDALSRIRLLPFGGGSRMLVVENSELFSRKLNKSLLELATETLCNLPENNRVAFIELKYLKSGKLSKKVSKYVEIIENNVESKWKDSPATPLFDAVINGDEYKTVAVWEELIQQQEPILKTISFVLNKFILVRNLQLVTNLGVKDKQELLRFLKIKNPGQIYYLKLQCKKRSTRTLGVIVEKLLTIEQQIKRGKIANHDIEAQLLLMAIGNRQ